MSWQRVRGHDEWIAGFRNVVRRGRLAHAYLFTGPEGIGKQLFARELGKALLCEALPTRQQALDRFDACDRCASCVQIEAGTHPDFAYTSKPSDVHEFPIDVIREVCHHFALQPARGRGKVVLIDDVDDFNEEAANCLLKTLEEPPAGALVILIGTTPDRQTPTIISRCQVVRFTSLAPAIVLDLLQANDIGEPKSRERLARLSGGSLGLARALADPAIWDFRQELLTGLLRPRPDLVTLGKAWTACLEAAGKTSALQRGRASLVIRLLISFFEDALFLIHEATPRRQVEPEDRPALEALIARCGSEEIFGCIERCMQADRQIERYMQLSLAIEALLDALARRLNPA